MKQTLPVPIRRSAGAGLVTAIFLLVVLAGLSVALVAIFTSQRQGVLLDEQGARAYQAARAGIEWGLYQRLRGSGCAPGAAHPVALGGEVLGGFTVSVSCTRIAGPASEDPAVNLDRWIVRSVACAPADGNACPEASGNPDFVRRVIEVQI
ncbi:agglutinin biogenesis protein MshP [Massilia sp. SYSU DXS3249]